MQSASVCIRDMERTQFGGRLSRHRVVLFLSCSPPRLPSRTQTDPSRHSCWPQLQRHARAALARKLWSQRPFLGACARALRRAPDRMELWPTTQPQRRRPVAQQRPEVQTHERTSPAVQMASTLRRSRQRQQPPSLKLRGAGLKRSPRSSKIPGSRPNHY